MMAPDEVREIMHDELVPVRIELGDLRKLMTGNGKPHCGLIVRMDRVERSLMVIVWMGSVLVTAMAAAGAWRILFPGA